MTSRPRKLKPYKWDAFALLSIFQMSCVREDYIKEAKRLHKWIGQFISWAEAKKGKAR